MVPDFQNKPQMICTRGTQSIEWNLNVGRTDVETQRKPNAPDSQWCGHKKQKQKLKY